MIHGCTNRGLMYYRQSPLQPFYHATPLILFLLLVPPSISVYTNQNYLDCLHPTPYTCGDRNYSISFPFWCEGRPDSCSYPGFYLECKENSMLLNVGGDDFYQVKDIDYTNRVLMVANPNYTGQSCPQSITNATLNFSLYDYATFDINLTVYFNCSSYFTYLTHIACLENSYYTWPMRDPSFLSELTGRCSVGIFPMSEMVADMLGNGTKQFWDALQEGFGVRWMVGQDWCDGCIQSGGACGYDAKSPDARTCFCPSNTSGNGSCSKSGKNLTGRNIAIGVGVGVAGLITACFLCCLYYERKKRRKRSTSSNLLTRAASSELSSKKDPELGSTNFHTPIFTYDELEEATNGFDASRELGDGGFGTVYKGELRDGRIVAVKRLYENNYKRVEQFVNEVDILSRLRHQNLVTLYGCTSRRSRELLLVYEFVPNGTVADHLHGPRAAEGVLTWAVRLNIAIETADALAYLHAVEPQIIHRDVKTNNILLDNSFRVKVADFGLSRLFPVHATHVSTLPQGTPGYVDPEYHQCYQLTDKSDVYSYGVVLVELISSKPAVDISRHRHEINLANMAINKIQNRELDQLVDPGLGYQADWEMERMITLVAELAFRCLQGESDMRPSIKEVLDELRQIQSRGEKREEVNVQTREDTVLLKNNMLYSPDSVTARWDSRLTTPNTSG